jgi:hypothetical protein
MWTRLLALALALFLLPAQALAGAKEKVAALAPSGLVLVMDAEGKELIAQNADQPRCDHYRTFCGSPNAHGSLGCGAHLDGDSLPAQC